jgi:hypothetical protein
MTAIDDADTELVLSGTPTWVDADLLETLSAYPLSCVDTEFPHYVHSVDSPAGPERPTARHPVFYGCFDWHSSVHSHWCLVRQLRLFDDHPAETDIVRRIDDRLADAGVARERAAFDSSPAFERPYGWGWFLRLAVELHLWSADRAADWRETLRPLEERIVDLVRTDLLTQSRPFRVGTHGNTAFALGCVVDYARVVDDDALAAAAADRARTLFGDDRDAPVAYEPLGWDFLSPSLAEADLMRRVLDPDAFAAWLDGFLPDLTAPPHDSLLDPVDVEPAGGVELHHVGLNLSRAWCLYDVAAALDDVDAAVDVDLDVDAMKRSARRHADSGLAGAFTDAYAGTHWLSTFVLYLLTRRAGGIAPPG